MIYFVNIMKLPHTLYLFASKTFNIYKCSCFWKSLQDVEACSQLEDLEAEERLLAK